MGGAADLVRIVIKFSCRALRGVCGSNVHLFVLLCFLSETVVNSRCCYSADFTHPVLVNFIFDWYIAVLSCVFGKVGFVESWHTVVAGLSIKRIDILIVGEGVWAFVLLVLPDASRSLTGRSRWFIFGSIQRHK